MGHITESVLSFFENDGWNFQHIKDESNSILIMDYSGTNGEWNCYVNAEEEKERFRFYSVCPVKPVENKRQAVAEFLTRVNYGICIGNFEFNLIDRKIRYKTSIDVEKERLSSQIIENLVYVNLLIMDTYLPGIMAVIYGSVSPKQAVEQVEEQMT